MGYYLLKRFVYSILTLYIIVTITFFLMHAIPGNIYTSGKNLPPQIIKNIEAKYGLDKSLFEQYTTVLKNLVCLDFGISMKNQGRTVNEIIAEHFPISAWLGLFSIAVCLAVGIPLGVMSALKTDKWQDRVSMILSTTGITVPGFVVAILAQYYLGVKLRIFPVVGYRTPWHLILPAVSLALFPLSFVARMVRSSMIEALKQDYIRTAWSKGLSGGVVIYKHALRNSIIPVVTYIGPLTAGVLTGSFVIERIFSIPGLGRYYVETISNRDYTTLLGITVFYAVFLIFMNFIVDIAYVFLDPRIRLKRVQ